MCRLGSFSYAFMSPSTTSPVPGGISTSPPGVFASRTQRVMASACRSRAVTFASPPA